MCSHACRRDLGAHIDGWIASQATSVVVQPDPAAPVTGRAADVISAAQTAMEAALRLVRPGNKVSAIPDVLAKVRARSEARPVPLFCQRGSALPP